MHVQNTSDNVLIVLPATSKLEPAYKEPPFELMQSTSRLYTEEVRASSSRSSDTMSRPNSSLGYNDNKSEPEAEMDLRRPSSSCERRRTRNRKNLHNPNELSLAQKMFLYKNVMAYKESDC